MVQLNNLGRNLHIVLYDKKMSKIDLARRVGTSGQMISYIVKGEKIPSAQLLVKIANVLNVTVDELLK